MELLPEELLIKISLHLNVKDVLNCSLLSKFWRNALNNNKTWFNLCWKEFQVKKTDKPVLEENCRVKPAFSLPPNDCDELSQLCSWRVRFMQEMRITQNWKSGKFKQQEMKKLEDPDLKTLLTGEKIICGHDFVITFCWKIHKLRVWQLCDDMVEKEPIICPHSKEQVVFLNLTDDGFLFAQDHLMVYYVKKKDGTFVQKLRVVISQDSKTSEKIPPDADLTDWYEKCVDSVQGFYSYCSNSKFFVAPIANGNEATFHIWDIKDGIKSTGKLKPGIKFFDIHMKLLESKPKLLIDFAYQGEGPKDLYPIFSYDFISQTFSRINLKITAFLRYPLMTEDHVIGLDNRANSVTFWNNQTGAFACTMVCEADFPRPEDYLLYISPSYVTACNGYKGIVRLLNTNSLTHEGEIRISGCLDTLMFIQPDMVLVQVDEERERDHIFTELYDLRTKCKLQTCYPIDCVVNSSRTKLIDPDQNRILHFW